jgi:hypothetical protein
MYEQFYYDEQYYRHYKARSEIISRLIKAFLVVCSCSSVAVIFAAPSLAPVWMVIVGLAQVVSSIEFLFPYEKQIVALDFFLPEMRLLLNAVEFYWNASLEAENGPPDAAIAAKIREFKDDRATIEQKYIGCAPFPRSKRIDEKAFSALDVFHEQYNMDGRDGDGNEQ